MATVELGAANFEATIGTSDIVLVDFWAAWCGPCRMFAPVFEKSSQNHPDIVFGKVDTEAEQALAGAAGIQAIPTLMAFREGVLVFRESGAVPAAALEDLIGQLRALDMGEIHAQVAEARGAAGAAAAEVGEAAAEVDEAAAEAGEAAAQAGEASKTGESRAAAQAGDAAEAGEASKIDA